MIYGALGKNNSQMKRSIQLFHVKDVCLARRLLKHSGMKARNKFHPINR
jgi:hypothetical protein